MDDVFLRFILFFNRSWQIFTPLLSFLNRLLGEITSEQNAYYCQVLYTKTKMYNLLRQKRFFFIDLLVAFKFSLGQVFLKNTQHQSRSFYRTTGTVFKVSPTQKVGAQNVIFSGLRYCWYGVRYWVGGIIGCVLILYTCLIIKMNVFLKVVFLWISLLMFCYWLLSGFVFFFKKYQFGKYTSVIQRFWRRSYILFWILEAFLFLVFFYLTVNASSESFAMFDQIQMYKTHLFSFRFFLIKLLPLTFLISIGYLLLMSTRYLVFSKLIPIMFLLTVCLSYVVWLEFYQFYHILNFYANITYFYDVDEHTWVLDNEARRTRLVNHYTSLLLILKFWHIVFIYVIWLFFILRSLETKRVRFPLLALNLQNFIILYLFAWVYMYPWLKYYFRRLLDMSYSYFYVHSNRTRVKLAIFDLYAVGLALREWVCGLWPFTFKKSFLLSNFYYYYLFSQNLSFASYQHEFLKNCIFNGR